MRILLATTIILLLGTTNASAQDVATNAQAVDPMDRYNTRLDGCADCYQLCAHRWDRGWLSEELERVASRARRECEERCANFMRLGENECRGAYLGRTLSND